MITIPQEIFDALARIRAAQKAEDYSNKNAEWKIINEGWHAILARYPLLFTGQNIGLDAGVGWWVALEDCFNEITGILNGYQGLVFNAVQIKEKFGGLRFYYDLFRADDCELTHELELDAREKIEKAIIHAMQATSVACEICGQPGTRRNTDWIKTLCDVHTNEE